MQAYVYYKSWAGGGGVNRICSQYVSDFVRALGGCSYKVQYFGAVIMAFIALHVKYGQGRCFKVWA